MAREMDIALRTMSRIIKQNLGFEVSNNRTMPYRCSKKKKKSRFLLSLYSKECYKEILFTDEKKKFAEEESFNLQNDSLCMVIQGSLLTGAKDKVIILPQ